MSDVSAMSDGQLIMKLVMQGFRSRDTESREVAAEFFIRRGVELVPILADTGKFLFKTVTIWTPNEIRKSS